MQNPFQSGAENPSGLNDPLSFVRKLWGDMQLPGMVTPSLSVDELDKQIRDLKTVESWLNINMNMLRASIQALEVQCATITALKAMGESFAQHQATKAADEPSASTASTNNSNWPMPGGGISEAQADAENLGELEDESEDDAEDDIETPASEPTQTAETSETTKPQRPRKSTKASSAAKEPEADQSAAFANPAAWWNVLQEQFKHALGQALKDEEVQEQTSSAAKSKSTKSRAASTSKPSKTKVARATTSSGTKKTVVRAATKSSVSPSSKTTKTAAKRKTTNAGGGTATGLKAAASSGAKKRKQ